MQGATAKGLGARAEAARKAPLARAEIIDKPTRGRLEAELEQALKRKIEGDGADGARAQEAQLAGVLRALGPMSPSLRAALADVATTLLRKGAVTRELYSGAVRCLAESSDKSTGPLLTAALASEDAGGAPALLGACVCRDAALAPLLAKIAGSRQSHLAFAAETARVSRGESNGANLASMAPMIKESHRISLCVELFMPLARATPLAPVIGPALAVLRSAERHLGRWLVLGEVAALGGDPTPIDDASKKSQTGPQSARAAWTMVHWAMRDRVAHRRGGGRVPVPDVRPTVELIARLSDRPSADRDPTFLFRLAEAGAPLARPMLEALAKGSPLADEGAVRAALYLARDHGRADMREALEATYAAPPREELRGLAAAALWDAGHTERAREMADALLESPALCNVAWGSLLRLAASTAAAPDDGDGASDGAPATLATEPLPPVPGVPLVNETTYRWVQRGWLE
jgi:hypothetical protein